MQPSDKKKPSAKFDMDKAKQMLKESKEEKKQSVITADDLKSLIQNLEMQLNNYNREANDKQTMAIKTQGALEIAHAQLQGMTNDTKKSD